MKSDGESELYAGKNLYIHGVVIDVTLFKLNSKAKILEEQKHIEDAAKMF